MHNLSAAAQDPGDAINEIYLRDSTQPAHSGTPLRHAHSTMESTAQQQIMQDSKRGVYQKIIDL